MILFICYDLSSLHILKKNKIYCYVSFSTIQMIIVFIRILSLSLNNFILIFFIKNKDFIIFIIGDINRPLFSE